jgi:ESX secretion-associated protein EspJ
MGQMLGKLGQVGQQVGQMAQAAGAPLQALAQPLQQLPQQVMQGVQQAVQQAGKAGGDPKAPGDPKVPGQGEETAPYEGSERPVSDETLQRAEAAPGDSALAGRAPDLPRVERAEPAQTRPQSE